MAQQIKKKFIQNDAVDGQKLKLQKDQSIRGQKQDGSEVELLKLDGSDKLVSGGQELAFKQVVDSQVSDLQGKLDSEKASRISGDETLQSNLEVEQSAREQADQGLQSQISTEKGRIDAILLASDADKDSFSEIVQLINSVDTENDSAFAGYVLSNNAALASEVSSRQQGDQDLQSNIDAEETRATGEESRIESKFDGSMSTEQAARIAGDSAEQSRAMGVESSLQSQITQEVSDRQSAVSSEASARIAGDSAEQTARIAADADLQSQHDDLDGYAQDIRGDLDQEIVDRAAAVSAEASARQSADSSLQSSLSSEVSRAQSAESTEQAARISGDSALSSRVTALEVQTDGPYFGRSTIVCGSGAVFPWEELDHEALPNSIKISVGRLALHEADLGMPYGDFSVSVVNGKSRITWNPDFLSSEEGMGEGDVVFITYAYSV